MLKRRRRSRRSRNKVGVGEVGMGLKLEERGGIKPCSYPFLFPFLRRKYRYKKYLRYQTIFLIKFIEIKCNYCRHIYFLDVCCHYK